jgi:hypothetical protein
MDEMEIETEITPIQTSSKTSLEILDDFTKFKDSLDELFELIYSDNPSVSYNNKRKYKQKLTRLLNKLELIVSNSVNLDYELRERTKFIARDIFLPAILELEKDICFKDKLQFRVVMLKMIELAEKKK